MTQTPFEAAFGPQLRECRQAAGLSLRQLAGRVGYDHSYLSQVERGQRPGSADLARLCDRALDTGSQLSDSYLQTHQKQPAAPATPADPLEAAWKQLAGVYGGVDDELVHPESIPPAQRLPELVHELRRLHARAPALPARSAQLAVLIAETLVGLGQFREARRWWNAGRAIADDEGEDRLRSAVRAAESVSGLAERRPLPRLLELADEALAIAQYAPVTPSAVMQAHAVRAQVLAAMGELADAHDALQQLLSSSDALPSASDLTPYALRGLEGRVCASLGYGTPGCLLLDRALQLCPQERLDERARLRMAQAACLAVEGEVSAGLALAMRVLVELPDDWHTYYLYDDAGRVLAVAREREPGLVGVRDLEVLLERKAYLSGRSVGGGSWAETGRG